MKVKTIWIITDDDGKTDLLEKDFKQEKDLQEFWYEFKKFMTEGKIIKKGRGRPPKK